MRKGSLAQDWNIKWEGAWTMKRNLLFGAFSLSKRRSPSNLRIYKDQKGIAGVLIRDSLCCWFSGVLRLEM